MPAVPAPAPATMADHAAAVSGGKTVSILEKMPLSMSLAILGKFPSSANFVIRSGKAASNPRNNTFRGVFIRSMS